MILSKDTERLVYFGDSLSDRGLIYDLTGKVLKVPLPPASEGYAQRFADGEVQSGITPALLGLETESYAAGGAQARGSRTIADYAAILADPDILLPPPLPQDVLDTDIFLGGQVKSFLADVGPEGAEPGTAAAIFIGANDYNNIDFTNPPNPIVFIGEVIGSIYAAAKGVDAAGADQVLLYNLPDPTFFPVELIYDPATIAFGQQLAAAHNLALAGVAAQLRSEGIDAQIVDIHRIAAEISADPRTFGLLPQYLDAPKLLGIGSRPTWDPGSDSWSIPHNPAVADVDPERLAYFDLLHPTAATHGVLGAFAAEYLTSELHLLGNGDDIVVGLRKDDLVLAGAGDDNVIAGAGDDVVLAGLGDDRVAGWGGDDILAGGGGDDTVLGGRGDDVIAGSDGDDRQFGAAGRDLLIDGLGDDFLIGGDDRDAFLYTEAAALGGSNATDGGRFVGGSGRDTLYLVLGEETQAQVEGELRAGPNQHLPSIDIVARSIERYVFLDPADDLDAIVTGARLEEADAWGLA